MMNTPEPDIAPEARQALEKLGMRKKPKKRKKRVNKDAAGNRIIVAYDGHRTGESLRKNDPAKYERIVGMLTMGYSYRQIREETGADLRTIGAINYNNGGASKVAKRIEQNLKTFAVDAAEQLAECGVDKIGLRNIPFALAVAVDKAQVLSGAATVIQEHRHVISSAEEWEKTFALIKQRAELRASQPVELVENSLDVEFQLQQPEQ